MGPHQLPFRFQPLKVAAHGLFGDAKLRGDFGRSYAAPGVEVFDQFSVAFQSKHWFFLCL
jgi:hypothetical protein